ncbi:MAG: MiaB/RimO family radical SAM methylthiotransferase [Anaerolineales bacterium]
MRIYLETLGCRLNQAEVEQLGREAARRGHTVVGTPAEADWAIINTCTVTHIAARKSRQAIRRLGQANAALRIAIIGCYGDRDPAAQTLPGVALVVPNLHKDEVLDRIGAAPLASEAPLATRVMDRLPCERTRAFVKVQDGCENQCAYCLVTIARGPARSVRPEVVLAMAKERRAEGANELVLSGVNIGSFGRDVGPVAVVPRDEGWSLARLARAILETSDVPRLRFSSIEPWDVTPDLLALWQDPRVCRQLHLPLQSGCEATLARMGRRMTAACYAALVAQARSLVPGLAVTTDIMVGFPGETDIEFEESLHFVEQMAFSRLHVFRYSPRPGTAAAEMPGQVAADVVAARSQQMAVLGRRLARQFHGGLVGQQAEVLFESATVVDGGTVWEGLTDTYVRVRTRSADDLANRLARVRITAADAEGVSGELL